MTAAQILALAVAAVALLGMVAVFAIAYRRETSPRPYPPFDRRAVRRDRSEEVGVLVTVGQRTEPEAPAIRQRVGEATRAEPEAVEAVEVRRVEEVSPEEAGVTRRQFFNRAILTAFGSYLALLAVSMLGFFWPKLGGGFGARIDAGDVEQLKDQLLQQDGTVIPAYVPEARGYVVPFPEGEAVGTDFEGNPVIVAGLTALYQRCVHLGCRVPWCHPSQGFECPCHGSKYNLHGEYEAGPAPRNLDRFLVEVDEGNHLIIDTSQIIQTARAQHKTVPYPQGPPCVTIG
ncbi:MAG: ubiquinol-cytochrome c reductase iron-sulfur subunit [Acidimicrobiia bacterium]